MALTAEQLADFQADVGIAADQAVFTDAELSRLYVRAGSDYNTAVALAIRQLMADAAKLNNYTAGASSERKSQVFDHLKAMYEVWSKAAGIGDAGIGNTLTAGVLDLDFMEKAE